MPVEYQKGSIFNILILSLYLNIFRTENSQKAPGEHVCLDFIHQDWITVMGSTWSCILKPLKLLLVQNTNDYFVSCKNYQPQYICRCNLQCSFLFMKHKGLHPVWNEVKGSVIVDISIWRNQALKGKEGRQNSPKSCFVCVILRPHRDMRFLLGEL